MFTGFLLPIPTVSLPVYLSEIFRSLCLSRFTSESEVDHVVMSCTQ